MQHTTYQELEQSISKLVYALSTYNSIICEDILSSLRDRLTPEDVAGVVLVSLERLIWFDANAFVWAVDHLIPTEIVREIRRLMSLTLSKRLISNGMEPGRDFSVDSSGRLLLSAVAQSAVLNGCQLKSLEC